MADGHPYLSADSWSNGKNGWYTYPDAQNAGAHDLAPKPNIVGDPDPFSHYEARMGRSSDGIPRPNEKLTNLPDVADGIRRTQGLGGNGPEGGPRSGPEGGPGGGPDGGSEGGSPGGRSAPPPKPFVPATPLPTAAAEGIEAVPAAETVPVAAGDAAPAAAEAAAAPLPEAQPAQAEPEPPPAVTAPDPATRPDFTGKLRGQDVTLPGVKSDPLVYTKRAEADLTALRKNFDSSARYEPGTKGLDPQPVMQNRSNFLKDLANDPTKEAALKAAGIDDNGIALMKQGKLPSKAWQVHHKLPLDDGGTNASDNLVLIENDPYHQVITNEQNGLIKNLKAGETLNIPNWPVPDGFVYPPVASPTPSTAP